MSETPGLRRLRDIGLPLWLLGLCWGIFNLGMMSLVVFTPDFLYSNGFSLAEAGSITSVIIIINTALSSFVGLLVV